MARPEVAPGIFRDCGDTRQRILDQISDPAVRKLLVMRWWEGGAISPDDAERLIHDNHLEAA